MRQPLIVRQSGSTNEGTAVDIVAPVVKPEQLCVVKGLAIANESGEQISAAFGILEMGEFTRVGAQVNVNDSDCYSSIAYLILREGEQLSCRVTGSALIGKVVLVVSGEICDWSEWIALAQQAAQ